MTVTGDDAIGQMAAAVSKLLGDLRISVQAIAVPLGYAISKSGDGIDYAQVQIEMAQRLTDADHARILPLKKMIAAAAQTIDSRDYEAAA